MKEIRTNVLERIEGFHWRDGWHGGLGGGVAIADSASISGGRDVFCDPWPEKGGFCACRHSADSLVSSVECLEAGWPQRCWYDYSVTAANDSVNCGE